MPPFVTVHLPHLAGPEDAVPPAVARQFDFYGDLARFASLSESGRAFRTPVQCRKRPGRKPCRGLLVVRRRDLPAGVDWVCPECAAQGRITGWEGTDADLRPLDPGRGEGTRAVVVSPQEHAALRDLARVDPGLIPLAYAATVVDDAGVPVLVLSEAECLQYGAVVLVHALRTSSPSRRRRLAELGEVLTGVDGEDGEDGEPPESFVGLDPVAGADLAGALLALEDAAEPEFVSARPRPRPRSTRHRKEEPRTFRIKVTLRDVKPPVWRRLIVPSDIRLPALHDVLQAAMGWYDCHLHAFRAGNREFAPPGDWEPIGEDSRGVTLEEIAPREGSRVVYEYDFGDGWHHDLVVEEVLEGRCTSVRCLKGRRRCPPEDCGGPWGYAELCEALADPGHERHDELSGWFPVFDPEEFDVVATDAEVRGIRV